MSPAASGKPNNAQSGLRKTAMLLVLLGDKTSAEIVKQFSEEEVQQVSREITLLGAISPENTESLLREFRQMDIAHGYAARGGLDYARKVLVGALGQEASKKLVDSLSRRKYSNIDIFQKVDPRQLGNSINDEHPQTIAIILSRLRASQAAELLGSLQPEMRADIAMRMGNLGYISPEIVSRIARFIGEKLEPINDSSRDSDDLNTEIYGGAHALAKMFNCLDAGSSREILEVMEEHNPNLVESIRHLMFVFPDLINIDAGQMKEIMDRIDRKVLSVALKGTTEALRDHFLAAMSTRAADMLKEEMESLGPVRIKEVETAQQQIIAMVRQLETEGVVTLKGSTGDQYVL
jgi:flagellar motor switch protein FliG